MLTQRNQCHLTAEADQDLLAVLDRARDQKILNPEQMAAPPLTRRLQDQPAVYLCEAHLNDEE